MAQGESGMHPSTWQQFGVREWRHTVLKHPGSGAREGVEACLTRIAELNPTLNAIHVLLDDEALRTADELDQLALQPDFQPGLLHGVPILIKDEIDVAGTPTTFGTAGNPTPKAHDSLLVKRLREAGAIILGKTLMPAFGAFPFTESEAFGITRNPWDPSRTPGGSSGGSAVAVAARMVPAAIGGDGGGSIRIPSSHCGTVGLKPCRGSVPTDPYADLWMELGTSGPIARSVECCSLIFDAIATDHTRDSLLTKRVGPRKLVIGVNTTPATPGIKVHDDHLRAVAYAVHRLRAKGHEVREVDFKRPDPTLAFVTQFYGGIREEIAGLEFPERIEPRHKRTKLLGAWARFKLKEWAREYSRTFGETMTQKLEGFDALLTPTVADRPARAGAYLKTGSLRTQLASLSSTAFAAEWNVSGHAAISLPGGMGSDGLPVGVQLVGPRGEADLLQVAQILDSAMLYDDAIPHFQWPSA